MRTGMSLALTAFCIVCLTGTTVSAGGRHRFGVGVHYWTTVEDLDLEAFKEDGTAYVLSYQYRPAVLLGLGLDVEMLPERYGGSRARVYAPQVYVQIGGIVYAGLGIGTLVYDGDVAEDPFYNLRAGLDVSFLPLISLDIHADYRVQDWEAIRRVEEDIGSDTITIGAAVRVSL